MFTKQSKNIPNLKIDDVVLIREDNVKRYNWKLGRIKKLIPGRDGKVRSCEIHTVVKRTEPRNLCHMSERCLEGMSAPRQRGYILTHQVLYWQMLQMHDCVRNVSESLQVSLCSNVLRDAEQIARARFPRTHRDLFMEQIGLCGMWGFRDFYRFDWLETILSWQQLSGCFNDRAKWHCLDDLKPDPPLRVKRREKVLKDGCLSHKTTVALLAITANIRFEAEQKDH
ncbi:UPF0764 protein C16orf89 homolog [Trichonephila clavata]|uniref:UPF0764 protein C16orf89 homolog n=1 Tax=Trichonephila clavata TaxID=2740835 RepID=A0A8X6LVP7_TRICU|nr:UPF0764 protein C16orf89 homolog [Trichonephila clavata]